MHVHRRHKRVAFLVLFTASLLLLHLLPVFYHLQGPHSFVLPVWKWSVDSSVLQCFRSPQVSAQASGSLRFAKVSHFLCVPYRALRESAMKDTNKCNCNYKRTRWFKYDRDDLCVNKSQFVPVIFEPPCIITTVFVGFLHKVSNLFITCKTADPI